MKLRSPAGSTVVGVGATLIITAAVVVVLLLFGGGAKAVSDNAALIGALVALGGVFTTQLVNSALEAQRAHDDAVQAYLDQMADLLIPSKDRPSLYEKHPPDSLRSVARARTLTVLSRLDGTRKGNVVQFLYESDLITTGRLLVDLRGANLSWAVLMGANLEGATLSGAVLTRATLSLANLRGADLSGVVLVGADLSDALLDEADLSVAIGYTEKQLRAALSSEGATMPDGQILKSDDNPDGPTLEEWFIEDRDGRKEDVENE